MASIVVIPISGRVPLECDGVSRLPIRSDTQSSVLSAADSLPRAIISNERFVPNVDTGDNIIVLNTLRYHEEIQPHPDVIASTKKATANASGRELTMALKLVEEMTEKWKPEAFSDTYRDDLMKRIEQKVKAGQTHTLTEPEEEANERVAGSGGKVVDLMSLLQRSLDQKGGSSEPAARATKRKHSAARRRTTNARAARRA